MSGLFMNRCMNGTDCFCPYPGIQMYRKGQTWTMKTADIYKTMFRKSLSPRRAEKKEVIAWTTVQSPQKAIS